jgi:hypothetical protein
MTGVTDWADGLDSKYGFELAHALPPELLGRLDTAAADLQAALLLVQAAVAVLDAAGVLLEDVGARYREGNGDASDAVDDALRGRTSYGRALDLAYAIDDELGKVL